MTLITQIYADYYISNMQYVKIYIRENLRYPCYLRSFFA